MRQAKKKYLKSTKKYLTKSTRCAIIKVQNKEREVHIMSKILKASNKNGASMVRRASVNEGFHLSDVYGSYSPAKTSSWNYCFNKFLDTPDSTNFHICSHNTFSYCVSWNGTFNGERAVFVETPNNSYIVLLDK